MITLLHNFVDAVREWRIFKIGQHLAKIWHDVSVCFESECIYTTRVHLCLHAAVNTDHKFHIKKPPVICSASLPHESAENFIYAAAVTNNPQKYYWSPHLAQESIIVNNWLCLSRCLSLCLSHSFKLLLLFLFLRGIEPFFGRHFSTKRCSSILI